MNTNQTTGQHSRNNGEHLDIKGKGTVRDFLHASLERFRSLDLYGFSHGLTKLTPPEGA